MSLKNFNLNIPDFVENHSQAYTAIFQALPIKEK